MDLFEDLKQTLKCEYISDLPRFWRVHPNSLAFIVLTMDFKKYDLVQWIDLCNYLQIPYSQKDITDKNKIRSLFKKHASI